MQSQNLTIIAIFLGPIFAVLITLWHQNRKEKRQNKFSLFRTLMTHRFGMPVTETWVEALNSIDVVFHDKPKVVTLWHEYFDILHQKNPNFDAQKRKYLDLIFEMAVTLGYKALKQTDIDRSYFPVGLGDQKALTEAIQKEHLTFLQNTNKLYAAQGEQAIIPQIKT